jgi:clathrin heavy chain
MTKFFYKRNMMQNIEIYVQQINGMNTPKVVGTLLDLQCNEDYIKRLVTSARNTCPIAELVEEVEKRNRLKLILDWLEARVNEGNTEPALYNALAKIYIDDSSKDPSKFLVENPYYDSRVVGKYAEPRDPHLAFIAYKRGRCDKELIEVTNINGLYKYQARYLVERSDPALWESVLSQNNEHRPKLIAQVIQIALPEADNPEEVSVAVKAFMAADLQNDLIELLEKIVLETSKFSSNRNLQNLLILTAIKADKNRVMGYVQRLTQYDGPDIATIAVSAGLYEEAFVIYKKFELSSEAIQILVANIGDMDRAYDFAENIKDPKVYSNLAIAQLNRGMVKEAIRSFIRAGNHEYFANVINIANEQGLFEDLIPYLDMCRAHLKHPMIESELMFAYAKTDNLASLQELISSPNVGQIQEVGDRCFQNQLYRAAKLLFNSISNYPRLCSTLIKMEDWEGAVEAARKASSTRTWKEVNIACVDAGKFRLAQICGLQLMQHGDELEELIRHYEQYGYFDEIIELLEKGLSNERSHVTIFTCLSLLYSKYKPEKLMEHLKLYYSKMNIPRCMRLCETNKQYQELTFLQIQSDEPDNAILTMIAHPEAWENTLFQEVIKRVTNVDVHYKAVRFYLEQHPRLVTSLLSAQNERIDPARVVVIAKEMQRLPLIKKYLQTIQETNNTAVNEALNDLYIEEEDYESLRHSVDNFSSFNALALAKKLFSHELLEFRRISAYLYKVNGKFVESVQLSKQDGLWRDAMETVSASKDPAVADDLLKFFVAENRPDCFAACLYNCYELIRPDVALELAWRNKMMDFFMPYIIQVLREYTGKVDSLVLAAQAAEAKQASESPEAPAVDGIGAHFGGPNPILQMQQMQQQMQQQIQQQMQQQLAFQQQFAQQQQLAAQQQNMGGVKPLQGYPNRQQGFVGF